MQDFKWTMLDDDSMYAKKNVKTSYSQVNHCGILPIKIRGSYFNWGNLLRGYQNYTCDSRTEFRRCQTFVN